MHMEYKQKINVLYEDNHLLVVEKPVNMLSQGDVTGDADLLTVLKDYVNEIPKPAMSTWVWFTDWIVR